MMPSRLASAAICKNGGVTKSIHRSDEQKNLYKALVDAYESDKLILDTYGDTGSKRRRSGKEPESTSAPKEKTSKTSGNSYEGSKSQHKTAGESAQTEEPMHTTKDLEEPAHQEFEIGRTTKLPSPDRDWNKTLPNAHGPVQPWLSSLAQIEDPRESFNELMDTPLNFLAFVMNRLKVDTLTPELLTGPTFELMKGSCKSLNIRVILLTVKMEILLEPTSYKLMGKILYYLQEILSRSSFKLISTCSTSVDPHGFEVKDGGEGIWYLEICLCTVLRHTDNTRLSHKSRILLHSQCIAYAITGYDANRAWKSVRPQPLLPLSIDARVKAWIAAATPSSPSPSLLSPLSSPLPRIPSAPLPSSPTHRDSIPEAEMPPRKRVLFFTLSHRFEIGESSAAAAARQPGQDIHEMYVRHQDVQDDRAMMLARIASLEREARYLRTRVVTADQESAYTRDAWSFAMDRIRAL
ncbi:hypothetical protein Tco_0728119 [Tanacetum coccineum]|uniref:Uncharacterized protein n=1 Tax=Tanacetum coccineum TaxID=301880 RepID=A0ABQ4YKB1_9ASTR